MGVAIEFKNVSKRFTYWSEAPNSLKTVLVDSLRGKLTRGHREKFTVLDDVSFSVRRGEFVGLMGRNGAGKSTIFKLIAGIYAPSSGTIIVNDQIAPMIELGAGFHPDLSGYENIFLNAAILGYSRRSTIGLVEQIIEFSELKEKIHMPIKNYSSGMLVRLGFSVAAHVPAPILLMDEVLAVGDLGFQEKCIRKIHSLHSEGRTILFVTHSPDSVREHCSRCIVIERAKKIFDGAPTEATRLYSEMIALPSGIPDHA